MSNHILVNKFTRCTECNKFKREDVKMKVGDKVSFAKTTRFKKFDRIEMKVGKIDAIGKDEATVLYRKQRYTVHTSNLVHPDSATLLSVRLSGFCVCGVSDEKS